MKKEITITLRTPKGTEWDLKTVKEKLPVVRRNAKMWGYQIVKVA